MEERLSDKIDERFRRGFMPYGVTQHPGHKPDLKESYELGVDLPLTGPRRGRRACRCTAPTAGRPDKPWLKEAAEAYFNAHHRAGHATC